jgi:pyridinium-3,5-biscarboxylic acid mononucleotide synthase
MRGPRARTATRTGSRELSVGDFARFDLDRERRTGVPEIVIAEGKSPRHLVDLLRRLQEEDREVLVSRLGPGHRLLLARASRDGLALELLAGGRIARVARRPRDPPSRGPIALLSAGTSDVPIADEARAVLETLGIRVVVAHDVGVAGLHRLRRALDRIQRSHPRAYLVFAGREGALPTVVAGLVRAPVVGVPTGFGYGRGGRGEAALLAMLQSCAPIAVVNIDAGVPAALFAAQLLAADPSLSKSTLAPRSRKSAPVAPRQSPRRAARRSASPS